MIFLVEMKVKGCLRKCVKRASIYGDNCSVEKLVLNERY